MRNNQKKNFAFVEYADERAVNDAVRAAKQEIGGRMVLKDSSSFEKFFLYFFVDNFLFTLYCL